MLMTFFFTLVFVCVIGFVYFYFVGFLVHGLDYQSVCKLIVKGSDRERG